MNMTFINEKITSFFNQPAVEKGVIQVEKGVPFCLTRVSNKALGIGGVYGTWGESYDNSSLPNLLESRMGKPLPPEERLNLAELGFVSRHHISLLSHEQNTQVEVEVGARFLREAMRACGWEAEEVEGLLIGMSAPITEDYLDRIAGAAGIPEGRPQVAG